MYMKHIKLREISLSIIVVAVNEINFLFLYSRDVNIQEVLHHRLYKLNNQLTASYTAQG